MANEIQLSVNLAASKGGASVSGTVSQVSTMAGDQMIANVQAIANSSEAITVGDVTTPGYVFFKNLDSTVNIYLSHVTPAVADATSFALLLPGDVTLVKCFGTTPTLTAIASAAGPANLLVVAVEL